MKKIQIINDYVSVVDIIHFPQLIRSVNEKRYLEGITEEPFYACDLGDIIKKYNLWRKNLPRIEPFYAIKCNPNDIVIKILAKLNIGFDCASRGEIAQVLNAGVPANHIIYANPCKQASYLSFAEENHVKMMTFDSIAELYKISIYHPSAELILRIFVGISSARCPLGLKFGAYMEDVPELFLTAQSLNLNLIGVSFHVGSGCFDPEAYRAAIILSSNVFDIADSLGIHLNILDLGGGFPGNLDTQDSMQFFITVCDTINMCIDQYFPPEREVRVIAEPGRYFVSSAFQLSLTVTSIRSNKEKDKEIFSYFLNDGVYGSFNCIIFDHYIGEHYLLDNNLSDETHSSVFWGPTCDSMDKILDNFNIPKLNVGDCVVFKHMGAYTMSAGSTFNGFQRPTIRYFSSVDDWQLLSPLLFDTLDDLSNNANNQVLSSEMISPVTTCYDKNT